jgi:hypothetical protein
MCHARASRLVGLAVIATVALSQHPPDRAFVALEAGGRADFGNALLSDAAAAIGLGPDMFINPILSGVIGEGWRVEGGKRLHITPPPTPATPQDRACKT